MGSFPEVRIVADRLEFTEFGPGDAATVKALVEAGDYTALPPEAPSRPSEVDRWLADGVHRHHDVGEEDGGVHPVAADRLEGELGRQGGVADGVEDRPGPARRSILGERPSGLAHEPHRRARNRLAEAGAHEIRVGVRLCAHPSGSMTTAVP